MGQPFLPLATTTLLRPIVQAGNDSSPTEFGLISSGAGRDNPERLSEMPEKVYQPVKRYVDNQGNVPVFPEVSPIGA